MKFQLLIKFMKCIDNLDSETHLHEILVCRKRSAIDRKLGTPELHMCNGYNNLSVTYEYRYTGNDTVTVTVTVTVL